MNTLYVLLFIALVACTACQRQQTEEKNAEIQREIQERVAAERQAQEQQHVTQDEAKLNPNEKASEMIPTPTSSASPEKRYDFKSQAQKFQPRRIVPMTSPIREKPPLRPTPSEPPPEN